MIRFGTRLRDAGLGFGLLILGALPLAPGHAQDIGIAAVVNDDIISVADVQSRLQLAIVSLAVEDSSETRRRLLPNVLRGLIDERLQMQEAKRLSVTVSEQELDRAINDLEQRNNMPKGAFPEVMKRSGVDFKTLQDQVRANIAWVKVVRRSTGSKGDVSKEEIDDILAQQAAHQGKPEHRVSEIFLQVDNPQAENEVRQTAERLIGQIRGGANFAAVARQFSQSATAATDGDLGWVSPGQQASEIDQAVARMKVGEVAGPIRSPAGYHILTVVARRLGGKTEELPPPAPPKPTQSAAAPPARDAQMTLHQVVLGLSPQPSKAEAEKVAEYAKTATAKAKACKDMEAIGKKLGTPLSGPLKNIKLSNLPPQLRAVVENLPLGQPSPPLPTPNGIVVLMVCERTLLAPPSGQAAAEPPKPPPAQRPEADEPIGGVSEAAKRKRIEETLSAQKMEQIAQRMLRELRRSAFLEIRQ